MPIIPAANVQGTMGSAERFRPTSIQGQILPSYTLPYLLTPPGKAAVMESNYDTSNPIRKGTDTLPSKPTLDQRLTLGSSDDYCAFDLSTFTCKPDIVIGSPTVLTSNRSAEIERATAIAMQDQGTRSLRDQIAGLNLFLVIGIPFALWFIARRFLK